MNELKATTAQEIVRNEKDCDYMDELFGGVKMPPTQVYLKSEADKVIAKLKEKHKTDVKELLCLIRDKDNNFNRAFDSEEKELRHQKYKRCLTMVRCCMENNHTLSQVTLNEITNHLQWLFNVNFFVKWAARWSKIAEQFKEGV